MTHGFIPSYLRFDWTGELPRRAPELFVQWEWGRGSLTYNRLRGVRVKSDGSTREWRAAVAQMFLDRASEAVDLAVDWERRLPPYRKRQHPRVVELGARWLSRGRPRLEVEFEAGGPYINTLILHTDPRGVYWRPPRKRGSPDRRWVRLNVDEFVASADVHQVFEPELRELVAGTLQLLSDAEAVATESKLLLTSVVERRRGRSSAR